tara:strand:- start:1217 stop:1666 length:450 start_codon:yes stop_codon:yes gene_type:complete
MNIVKAAGGVVMNPKGEILLIHRRGFWDIPKGKLDGGERFRTAAKREVAEEVGIPTKKLKVGKKLCETNHVYAKHGGESIKKTAFYLMFTKYNKELKPETLEGITRCEWFPLSVVSREGPIFQELHYRNKYVLSHLYDLDYWNLIKKYV